jgi:uncharacterized protein (TIGR03067 family)
MLRCTVLVLTSLVLIAADAAPPENKAEKKDEELVQGTWLVESVTLGGEAQPKEIFMDMKITVKGDKMTIKLGENAQEATFKLDAGKKPKHIDATFGDRKGEGIYELDGDIWRICHGEFGDKRPTEMKSEKK